MKFSSTAPALLALACFASPVRAAESFDNCAGFINTLPAVIATQGVWCLNKDLATGIASGAAITINTNNVTIDCNDYKLGGLSAGAATEAIGISASNRQNLRVRNCNIRGFRTGLSIAGSGHLVEDNSFNGNTYVGLFVGGDGSTVRRNFVLDTGGSTVPAYLTTAYGIVTADNVDVVDNTVDGVQATGDAGGVRSATGIQTNANLGATVSGNRLRSLIANNGGVEVGIDNVLSGSVVLVDNLVNGRATPSSPGIRCATASGVAVRNVLTSFPSGLVGCTNGGSNVIAQ